jgi:PST family polysaccharide transporter
MDANLGAQVFKASSWLVVTRIIVTLLTITSTFVLARLLTPEDFGLVALASVVSTLLQSMVQIPVGQALVAIEKPTKAHFDTAFTINVIRTLLISVLLISAAIPIATFYEEPRVTWVLIVLAIAIFSSGLSNPKFILFEKSLNFSYIFLTNTVSKVLAIVVSLLFAYYTKSYWALVVGSLITQLLNVMFTYYFLPYRPSFSLKKHDEILSFSIWVSLSKVINNITWKIDQLLIGKLFGTISLGVFKIGTELASLPTREATTPLNRALFPAFSKINNDSQRFANAYLSSASILYSLLLPVGFGLSALAEPVIYLTLGQQWAEAAVILKLFAGLFALISITAITKAIAMAKGKTKIIFKRDMLFFAAKIIFSSTGLYLYGFQGLLFSIIVNVSFVLIFNFHLVRYLTDISFKRQLAALSRPMISASLMAFSLTIFNQPELHTLSILELLLGITLQILTGAIIYCTCHYFLWLIQGKPDGIEFKILNIMNKVLKREK